MQLCRAPLRTLSVLGGVLAMAMAQSWQTARAPGLEVQTAAAADRAQQLEVFAVLQQAQKELRQLGLPLPTKVRVRIHPSLTSFQQSTGQPWFVLATSDRSQALIQTQRLRILSERQALRRTLRHELFHLAQPAVWPRWKAEGEAMRFAGERPTAQPYSAIGEAQLNALLANPPNPTVLAKAMATAYAWAAKR